MAGSHPNSGVRGTAGMKPIGKGQYEPTTSYLIALVIAEYVAYCVFRYVFRDAHGG